jgi:uncharacterized protein (TIGR03437 family)
VFDGIAAPLIYVSENQVNALTPRRLLGQTTTHMCVVVNRTEKNCIDAPVLLAAPGIFSTSAPAPASSLPVSSPFAAALNQDGTVNSQDNPAQPGSIVSIFATGLGTISPAPQPGAVVDFPLPKLDTTVRVRALLGFNTHTNWLVFGPADVVYAGLRRFRLKA